MILPRLVQAILLLSTFFFGQTPTSSSNLVEDFRQSLLFFEQFGIGRTIIASNDSNAIDNLKDLLGSEDRHVRGNAALVFAGLRDDRGLEVITDIIQDKSYRVQGQGLWLQGMVNIMSSRRF